MAVGTQLVAQRRQEGEVCIARRQGPKVKFVTGAVGWQLDCECPEQTFRIE